MSGINISDHFWYALRTTANCEFKAAAALQERGIATAVPYEMRKRRKSRHGKATLRFPHAHITSYVFAGFLVRVPPWRALLEDWKLAPLIRGPVSVTSDGMPTLVRPTAIFGLQVRYGTGIYELPPKSVIEEIEDQQLEVGMEVRVGRWKRFGRGQEEFDTGGFAGKIVTISQIEGDMAKVILPMFGVEREARVPVQHLQAA